MEANSPHLPQVVWESVPFPFCLTAYEFGSFYPPNWEEEVISFYFFSLIVHILER